MNRTRQSQKRQHSSPQSSDEDKPKKKKSPKANLELSEDSSSDSDIETYLIPPSKLDLNSSFFNTIETTKKDEKIVHKNTDVGRLSDSESDEELKSSNNKSNHNENEVLNEIPTTSTNYNFEHISTFNQKLEEAKKLIEAYKIKKAKEVENVDMDVDDILYNEEKALYSSLGSSGFETLSDGENKSDWEEVEDKEDETLVRKEGVQITIDLPGNVKKKKSLDLMAAIKRRINRKKKEHQVLVHKVHLLCWIGHGFHINTILSDQNLLGVALSLLPSKHCYPTNRIDLSYLENITGWYKQMMINKNMQTEINEPLEKLLEEQMLKKEALNYKMLIMSLQIEPLRPPQSELCSLSNKSKKEPENLGEKKIESTKKKKITKRVSFNLNKSSRGDKSFNTSLKCKQKKTLKLTASKKHSEKSNVESKDIQVRRSTRMSSKSPTIQEMKKNKDKIDDENQPKNKDDAKIQKLSGKKSVDSNRKKSTKKSDNQVQLKGENLNDNKSKINETHVGDDTKKKKSARRSKSPLKEEHGNLTSSNLAIRKSTRKNSKSPVFTSENEDKSEINQKLAADDESTKKKSESENQDNSKINQELTVDDNSKKRRLSRRSKSPVKSENGNSTTSSNLPIRKSTRKTSKSPILKSENEGKFEINQKLLADDESKNRKSVRSKSSAMQENENVSGTSDLTTKNSNIKESQSGILESENEDNLSTNASNNETSENSMSSSHLTIRKSTRKNSKSPVLKSENKDKSAINEELSAGDSNETKSARSGSPVKPENGNSTSSKLPIRKSTRKKSKSPILKSENEDKTEINQELSDDVSKEKKSARRSRSPVKQEDESSTTSSKLPIRKSTRKKSKSPVLKSENGNMSEINQKLLTADETNKKKSVRSKSPVMPENDNVAGTSNLIMKKSSREESQSPALESKNDDDSEMNQELSIDDDSKKQISIRSSQSPVKPENGNSTSSSLVIRKSTRKTSKSPIPKSENEDNSNINQKLSVGDDSKNKKSARKSTSTIKLENENLISSSDHNIRKSTRKSSKSPVIKQVNEDNTTSYKELSVEDDSKKKKSPKKSNSPINSGNENLTIDSHPKVRRSTRTTSKSPVVDNTEILKSSEETIKNKTKKRKSKSPVKQDTLPDDQTTEIKLKSERFKVKPPIPTRLRNLNDQDQENDEESDDDINKIKFIPPANIKKEPSNSQDSPNEDEEFRGFDTSQIPKLIKKTDSPDSHHKEFLGFSQTPVLIKKSTDSPDFEIEGFRGFTNDVSNNNVDAPISQIPQLDGGADTPPKNKKKPNLKKLKIASSDKCSKVHLKRLKIPTQASKHVDSEDEFQPSCSSITKTNSLKRIRSVFSTSSPDSDKSGYFDGSPPKKSKQIDVRNDIVALVKGTLAQEKATNLQKLVKKKKTSSEEDSDFLPGKISSVSSTTKVKRRVPMKKDLVEIEKKKADIKKDLKKSKEINVWVEVFAEAEEKWISVDVIEGQVHCVKEIYSRASHPVSYILGFDNENHVKDITKRYCENWNTVTRKLRIDQTWWDKTLFPYKAPSNAREKEEDDDLARQQLDQPLPKTISEYKDHPLYALERHLLKFQAIYPPNALTIGFVRNEPVYARDCVYTLHSREIWLKDAKVVKPGEKPYKIVKARPKWDKLSNTVITDQLLEIFGIWQVEEYVPPTAENGIVPKNAYGNVDLFKPQMLPKGTVHLQFPALNKVARKLNIDCPPAVTGFDFHSGFSHPIFDGFVVCEEFSEQLIAAWIYEQEEFEKKEKEKNEKRIYDNWKKLIKGLLIRERLNRRYAFGTHQSKEKTPKDSKKKPS